MKTLWHTFWCWCLAWALVQPAHAQLLHNFRGLDLDSAGYEWTAISMPLSQNSLVVATTTEQSAFSPAMGDFRLRTYDLNLNNPAASAQTLRFSGKMRVWDMIAALNDILVAGTFTDTCYFGADTLIAGEAGRMNAFVASIDINTQQVKWVWHRSSANNHQINKIRVNSISNGFWVCGIMNDTAGWVGNFQLANGQLIQEYSFPGLRTLSDAIFQTNQWLLTGTTTDAGFLGSQTMPPTNNPSGYRSYLARYFPANDSAIFVSTLPYDTLDLHPAILVGNASGDYAWSAASLHQQPRLLNQMYASMGWAFDNFTWKDSVTHARNFINIENQLNLLHGQSIPHSYFFTPEMAYPEALELGHFANQGIFSGIMLVERSSGSSRNVLTDLRERSLVMAFKTTGYVEMDLLVGNNQPNGAFFQFDTTNAPPRWVAVTWVSYFGGSVADGQLPHYKLYPNPAVSSFEIALDPEAQFPFRFSITDLQGRQLHQGSLEEAKTGISCEHLNSGMYLFILEQNGQKRVKKLLIRK